MIRKQRITSSLALLLLLLTSLSLFSQTAAVKFVIGKVEYRKKGDNRWKRVRMRTLLRQGDQIKTSFESRIEIRTPDKTIVRLGENSVLDLNMIKTVGKKKTANKLKLWGGRLWAKFTKLFSSDEEEHTISTPTAVAAIRGTELDVTHDESTGESNFNLKEGKIEVRTGKGKTDLTPGNNAKVNKNGKTDVTGNKNSSGGGTGDLGNDKNFNSSDSTSSSGDSVDKTPNFLQLDQSSRTITDQADLAAGLEISGQTRADADLTVNGQLLSLGSDGSFSTMLSPSEGKLSISVSSKSAFGNINRTLIYKINLSEPEVFLGTSEARIYTAESNFELSIQATDATPDDILSLFINGNAQETSASPLNSNSRVQLNTGSNIVVVEVKDEVGHTAQNSFEVILDNTPPEIRLSPISTAPIMPTTSYGEQPPGVPSFPYRVQPREIIGQIIDQDPSSVEEIFINGQQVPVENGNFSYLLELNNEVVRELIKDGKNYFEINISVKDKAGNELTQNEQIEIVRLNSNR